MTGFQNGLFADRLTDFGGSVAVKLPEGVQITYAELTARVTDFRKELPVHRGLVFLLCRNELSVLVAYLACLQARMPMLLLDANIEKSTLETLERAYQPVGVIHSIQNTLAYRENSLAPSNADEAIHPDLALMLSTSGSTGSPKQVKLSYRNLQSNATSIAKYLRITAEDSAITSLPFHYSYGLSVINSHLLCGATLVLSNDSVISRPFWQQFDHCKPTSIAGVPHSYEMMRKLRVLRRPLHRLRYMTQAGGKLDKETVLWFAEGLREKGIDFFVMYGQTEATARMSYLCPEEVFHYAGSIGKPIPGGRFELVDNDGRQITAPNTKGELIYYGDNVMMGYAQCWKDLSAGPAATMLRTGDLATFDGSGHYYLCGRKDRTIKVFGHRLDLDNLQQRLIEHGFNVICAGEQDKVVVAVLGEHDQAVAASIMALLGQWLPFNVSAINVVTMAEYPKTANGKIAYAQLLKVTA